MFLHMLQYMFILKKMDLYSLPAYQATPLTLKKSNQSENGAEKIYAINFFSPILTLIKVSAIHIPNLRVRIRNFRRAPTIAGEHARTARLERSILHLDDESAVDVEIELIALLDQG